jgi:hypothetical protein
MPWFEVSVVETVSQDVEYIIEAENEEEAQRKAKEGDYTDSEVVHTYFDDDPEIITIKRIERQA